MLNQEWALKYAIYKRYMVSPKANTKKIRKKIKKKYFKN